MSQIEKEKPKTAAQTRKWKEGTKYQCINSQSPGYKVGKVYTSYKNANGIVCLTGEDGFEDVCSMLVSGFKEATDKRLKSV